ncbi:hypothetical protein HNY42_14370 [Exiguobacterium sp. Helios]|uniref:hypothetical protein n=1 Tax=Exiguobacterium sp. Helios TaxID=2735868 RepID=UPI00103FDA2B|nr:hypothetical protein [Exiguobacterium sp. Helios]QNR22077.1 hypothetical protein HNY42_14370 [Exiguobacterium sp. Helios]
MKQFFGLILTAALTMSLVSGPSYNESAEAAKPTDVDWLKQVKTTAAKAKSLDGKVTLEKTTLAQVHSAYKGEKNSTWCQSGKGLVAPNKAIHYCSTFGVPDRKAKVSAIVYNPKMIGRTITVKEVKKAYSTAQLDKNFNLMTVSTKEVNIYLNLNSDRTQVMSILVKYN